ncbi:fucose isomerase [Cnuibacter physcomitrellae]|uniref:RbsD/FucU family protein n=1 Tax=Cnuibacter physcomitrellae TaxID=1619308 RepID=UPI002175D721|nr:RbsD/FucU domain-containing protein [Cnuibacter physcomitrellae]MCS5498392.1 fucose isomerase [Cnuibacter physcomitrellae]
MLKGVNPLLSGDLLKVLDDMGHGDVLVLADRNFPAHSSGRPVIRVSTGVVDAVEAILSVFPLDSFVEKPLGRMQIGDDPTATNDTQLAVLESARSLDPHAGEFEVVPRFEVYERARAAYAVVQTIETAPYCVFLLTKGVV